MPRVKCFEVLDNFYVKEKKDKVNMSVYECKHCNKCIMASSSSRLKNYLDNCKAFVNLVCDETEIGSSNKGDVTFKKSMPLGSAQNSSGDSADSTACSSTTSKSSNSFSDIKSTACASTSCTAASSAKYSRAQSGPWPLTKFVDSINSSEVKRINVLFARWIYAKNVPFNMVESDYFKELIQSLRPAFVSHLPSRYELSNPMLDEYYTEVKCKVAKCVNNAPVVCLISDGWSNIRGESIINFVLTTSKPVFCKSIATEGNCHTAAYIAAQFCDVISEVGSDKVCGIVTDNAANMKAAWGIVQQQYPHIFCTGCTAHAMHLLCMDLVKKVEFINDVCKKCEAVVNHFCNHHSAKFELQEQQRLKYGKSIALCKYTTTRWGTVHKMFSSLLSTKEGLLASAGSISDSNVREILLDETFWHGVTSVCDILKPLVEAILIFEKDDPNLAIVYPKLFDLQQCVMNISDSDDDLRSKVKSIFDIRWQFIVNNTMLLAHFLHPSMHGYKLLDVQFGSLRMFLKEKYSKDFSVLWPQMLHYKAKSGPFNDISIWEDAALESIDSITWWRCYGSGTPLLQKLAIAVLNIPCSSAGSERCWSTMKYIHDEARNRLTNDKVEKLTYIYFNERMMQ